MRRNAARRAEVVVVAEEEEAAARGKVAVAVERVPAMATVRMSIVRRTMRVWIAWCRTRSHFSNRPDTRRRVMRLRQ